MGRQRRPYLPGGVFHLMARTLRREHRFTPRLRTATLRIIAHVAPHSGMRVLAAAVMSNHLHIVAQQGSRPLSALMQPLLRRLAGRLQTSHDLEGPVFWRPYASVACMDPWHARNAIAYTHLNPVRAGLCDAASEYPWTTHRLYAPPEASGGAGPGLEGVAAVVDPELALPLFATGPRRSSTQLRHDYSAFVRWRASSHHVDGDDPETDPTGADAPPAPEPWRRSWAKGHGPLFQAWPTRPIGVYDGGPGPATPELADVARRTLAAEAPGVEIEAIRGRLGGARASRLRHIVIRRLHAAGFRNVEIARFIGLSESGVSYVVRKGRRQ